MTTHPPIRFAAIGLNHGHIFGMTSMLLRAGAELAAVYAKEEDLLGQFCARFDQATAAPSAQAILEDPSIQLIITAAIPAERAGISIAAMRHGKDVMSDKAGMTTLGQLEAVRQVQAETGQIYSICYSERFENQATVKALDLVREGAIGDVVQTLGLGPHSLRNLTRPPWFWRRATAGGIITDIASHQFDQFLAFTGAYDATIASAQVANFHHPEFPEFEDFGDIVLQSPTCTGYIRVDWFTPAGLPSWGDTRLTIIGSEGYMEVRKNVDIAGREGANHLFLINQENVQYIHCEDVPMTYANLLLDDLRNRTETAMTHDHCFRAMELALRAQAMATRLGHLG